MPPRFYLDEDVTEKLVTPLVALGFDVVSTRQLGRKGSQDFAQLLFAATADRVLITHNATDFRLLHGAWLAWSAAWGVAAVAEHPGILIIEPGSGKGEPLSLPRLVSAVQMFVALPNSTVNRLFAWNAVKALHELAP
jgi:hypothetical protein